MASWTPSQAAEYKTALLVGTLRALGTDKQARRGFYRLRGMARASPGIEVKLAGLSLLAALPGGTLGQSHGSNQQEGENAQLPPSRVSRNKTDERKEKERKKLVEKQEAKRKKAAAAAAAAADAAAPTPAAPDEQPRDRPIGRADVAGGEAPSSQATRDPPPPPQPPRPPPPPPPPGGTPLPQVGRRPLTALRELSQSAAIDLCSAELNRVANSTRSDIHDLLSECEEAERAAVLRTAAGLGGEEPLTRGERALVMIERLWSFEDDWRARSAPECHMEAEWEGGAPT